jgi:hypothetical protein
MKQMLGTVFEVYCVNFITDFYDLASPNIVVTKSKSTLWSEKCG